MGISKFPQLGLPQLWGHITWCVDLWLQWGLNQSCSPCQELSNGMSHVACTRRNWVDSWLLTVRSQIGNLTPDLSFGHNLCFKCLNERCEPILDIYTSIAFQWYKEKFEVLGIQLPTWSSFGSARVHSLTLFGISGSMWCDSWVFLLARNLATPCFGREPKARVVTLHLIDHGLNVLTTFFWYYQNKWHT
jgi:hypothetical protein